MPDKLVYSVVIPLFNKEKTIDRAIDSVLNQNHDVELIVVDDGSTDNGPQKVKSRNDSRIRLIRQNNGGVSSARNIGINHSSHELVALLDADDEWLPGFLDQIDALVAKCPNAGAYTTSYQTVDNGETSVWQNKHITHPFIGIPDYFQCARATRGYSTYFCSSSIVLRIGAIKKIGGFRQGIGFGEDIDAWGRLALEYPIAHSSFILVNVYRDGENHASKKLRVDHHPFIDSISLLLGSGPIMENYEMMKYVDKLVCLDAIRHLFGGKPTLARNVLGMRPNDHFNLKILALNILSFFPIRLLNAVRTSWQKIRPSSDFLR